jgi:acetyl-CoA acetyltransferase
MNRDSDIVVCGGQEVMSQGHHTIFMRQGINGHQQLTDSVVHDVLTDAFIGVLMGNTGNVCMHTEKMLHIFRRLLMSSGAW